MPKIEFKEYKCSQCGHKKTIDTNHYGECYSIGNMNCCPECPPFKRPTTWVYDGVVPEGGWVPEPWKTVKLGDIVDIVEVKS